MKKYIALIPALLTALSTSAAIAASVHTPGQPIPADVRYEAPVDLGSLNNQLSPYSWATGLNDNLGTQLKVVGDSYLPNYLIGPFIWANGVMQPVTLNYSHIYDINNDGVAVGLYESIPGNAYTAFYLKNGVAHNLPDLSATKLSRANAINNKEKIVGNSAIPFGSGIAGRAVSWVNGNITDLGVSPGYLNSYANGVSDNGLVVGLSATDLSVIPVPNYPTAKAVMWDQNNVMKDLDKNTHNIAYAANGINNSGVAAGAILHFPSVVIGSYSYYGIPVRWVDGRADRLNGTIPGIANDINNKGQIVGSFGGPGYLPIGAFMFSNEVFYDLNHLIPQGTGWSLVQATAINENGYIVGYGIRNGEQRGFLLVPKK